LTTIDVPLRRASRWLGQVLNSETGRYTMLSFKSQQQPTHGFHVHELPDCSGDGAKTDVHLNPDRHAHSQPVQGARLRCDRFASKHCGRP
jgi:Cu/Zn superoxide dismutase